ncbi:hypothetical protein ASZ78_013604, partial [Callipepla squamata]
MDPVGDSISYGTMVCPCCQHAWFHRACIQEQALCAGIYCFRCPICRDRDRFIREILTLGIRIPFRRPRWEDDDAYASLLERHGRCDASECHFPHGREQAERVGPQHHWEAGAGDWVEEEGCHGLVLVPAQWVLMTFPPFSDRRPRWEDNDAYASLLERHGRCDASECHYPHGREQAERAGPWELLLCSSCAAQGTHRHCSHLSDSTSTWECSACAGEGTGKRSKQPRAARSGRPCSHPFTLE